MMDLEGQLAQAKAEAEMYRTEINCMHYDFRVLIELYKMLDKNVYVEPGSVVVRDNDAFYQTWRELRDEIFKAELMVGRPGKGKP